MHCNRNSNKKEKRKEKYKKRHAQLFEANKPSASYHTVLQDKKCKKTINFLNLNGREVENRRTKDHTALHDSLEDDLHHSEHMVLTHKDHCFQNQSDYKNHTSLVDHDEVAGQKRLAHFHRAY